MVQHVPLHRIDAGGRFRKDPGDLDGLASSMAELGLLQPVGLTPSLKLIFGGRRLEAARLLRWETIPAVVLDRLADAVAALRAERDENRCRKEMTPTELVELGRALEAVERDAARHRQGRPGAERSGKLPEHAKGQTRDRVGDALGVGARTYEKARQVVEAAEADPEVFGDLPDLMDGRSVDAAHRAFRGRAAALAGGQPALPAGAESGSLSPPGREGTGPPQEASEMAWTPSERERRNLVEGGRTVVANLKLDARLVAWAERKGLYVRIDRATAWGNPFVLGEDGDRPAVLRKYARYFAMKDGLKKKLPLLRGKVLGCWCHPEPCHGNHLIKLAESAHEHDAP